MQMEEKHSWQKKRQCFSPALPAIWAGQASKSFYKKKDKLNIVLLLRDSEKNRKKFANYLNDPSVKIVWGDLKKYDDVLKCVEGFRLCSSCRRNGLAFG